MYHAGRLDKNVKYEINLFTNKIINSWNALSCDILYIPIFLLYILFLTLLNIYIFITISFGR